jgi:hypothetical protein
LAQCVSSVLGVLFRPEERKQGVSGVMPPWRGESKIGEESGTLGLRNHSAQLLSFGASEVERTQCPQADHLPLPVRRRVYTAQVSRR